MASRDLWRRTARSTPGGQGPIAATCWCGAPRWNRTKLCSAHYFQAYRRRRPGFDSNAARKRRHQRTTGETPRCRNRWCRRPLDVVVLRTGHTQELPCERCARFAKGCCYACNDPLTEKDVRGWNRAKTQRLRCRWHLYCFRKRHLEAQIAANKRYLERHPEQHEKVKAYRRRYWHEYESPKTA